MWVIVRYWLRLLCVAAPIMGLGVDFQLSTARTTEAIAGEPAVESLTPAKVTLTLLWKRKTSGQPSADPVIYDGRVYFPSQDNRLEIFDLADGHRLRRERYRGPVSGVRPHDSLCDVLVDQNERRFIVCDLQSFDVRAAFAVPAAPAAPLRLSDSTVVICALDGAVGCHRLSGETIWTAKTTGPILSAPVRFDTSIYVASGRRVVALSERDGRVLWSHGCSGTVAGGVAVSDRVYAGSTDSLVYALDRLSGAMDWFAALGGGVYAEPVVSSDHVFVSANDGLVYALNRTDGQIAWKYDTGAIANLPVTVHDELVLIPTRKGLLLVLDAASGQLLTQYDLEGAATSKVTLDGDILVVSDAKRNLYCIRIGSNGVSPSSQSSE